MYSTITENEIDKLITPVFISRVNFSEIGDFPLPILLYLVFILYNYLGNNIKKWC